MRTATILLVALGSAAIAGCQKTEHGGHGGHAHGTGGQVRTEHGGTVPEPVATALERQSPGAKITKFHSHTRANGTKSWHLYYTTPGGTEEQEAKFEANGDSIE